MIFLNSSGAPELACDESGFRRFDRTNNQCYECGAEMSDQDVAEFEAALRTFSGARDWGAQICNER